jgi:ribose transport system permease protein
MRRFRFEQETIVLAIAILIFVAFSILLDGFLSSANIINLVRNVSVLGILGIGMAVVIIGRGIDLSIVANMAISVAWAVNLIGQGHSLPTALAVGFAFALLMALLSGVLIAYVEVPALFATLAMATFIYGFGHFQLVTSDLVYLPVDVGFLRVFGNSSFYGMPNSILAFGGLCFAASAFLRFTQVGKFIYAIGDNYLAARITGIPARPLIVVQYLLAGGVAFFAGIVLVTTVTSMDTRIANSTLIYDVILVAVLGGVGLSGGKGSVRNVVIGTLLVGVLFNGLTIMNVPYTLQNVVKALTLLAAIIVDALLNPRDEQTAQQGDI